MSDFDADSLTPTQDLVMELLAARHRLGEVIWTMGARHTRTLRQLEALGLVGWKGGIVEHTVRAWLEPAGRAAYLSPGYVPPIARTAR